MSFAFIYYYWSDSLDKVIDNKNNPVILSIATIRNFNKDASIYVLDVSKENSNWEDYPELLNFKVKSIKSHYIERYVASVDQGMDNFLPNLSKIFEVHSLLKEIDERFIIVQDADLFWLKPPLPLVYQDNISKFCCNKNTGLYYFDKFSVEAQNLIELWKATTLVAIYDKKTRNNIKNNYHVKLLICESIMWYILNIEPGYCHIMSGIENFLLSGKDLFSEKPPTNDRLSIQGRNRIKAIHLLNSVSQEEGLSRFDFALNILELKNIIKSQLQERIVYPNQKLRQFFIK